MDDAIQLRAGDEYVHLLRVDQPELALRVLGLLDGRIDRDALLRELGAEHEGFVVALLSTLDEWLVPASRFDYLAHFGDVAPRLAAARVLVCGHTESIDALAVACHAHEIAYHTDLEAIEPHDLIVCAIERPDLALQHRIAELATRAHVACLFVDLSSGRHATLGPLYVPSESACIVCFRTRLHENSESPAELAAIDQHMLETERPLPAFGLLPAHRQWVLGMAMTEVIAFYTRHRPLRTLGRAVTVSFEELRTWSEPVWRVPGCPVCDR